GVRQRTDTSELPSASGFGLRSPRRKRFDRPGANGHSRSHEDEGRLRERGCGRVAPSGYATGENDAFSLLFPVERLRSLPCERYRLSPATLPDVNTRSADVRS